ncbi:MAG: gamma-glutamyl-gamma-aminobutyrate hydrolase family protein [Candidatus Zixiibacteriota bacterium]|nr:MAG: gamma-glutamyl-gamma-aminobutyrate hydrolase family protein [candidate division Zixibacteria bacterium]
MDSKKPKIGITLSATVHSKKWRWPSRHGFDYLKRDYHQAVINAGGIPILLANTSEISIINDYVESIDGLLVSGGEDLHPKYFGRKPHKSITLSAPERDEFEIKIIKRALNKDIPVFGICRGFQVMNIALGGTIFQDLSCAPFGTIKHADPKEAGDVYHRIKIEKSTLLYEIIGARSIEVNSSHHQIIDKIGKKLKVTAYSSDGVIEGFEGPDFKFLLAVQWHPEMIPKRFHSKRLFKVLIETCRQK